MIRDKQTRANVENLITNTTWAEKEKMGLKKRATITALLLCIVFSYIYVKQVFN